MLRLFENPELGGPNSGWRTYDVNSHSKKVKKKVDESEVLLPFHDISKLLERRDERTH